MLFVKKYYKFFFGSFLFWLLVISFWTYLEIKYKIPSKYISKLSQEFILTTGLGLITTVFSALYNYQKNKTKQNQEAIKESNKLLEAYNARITINTEEIEKTKSDAEKYREIIQEAITRLEDTIDQQTFELRRLDDFNLVLSELRSNQNKSFQELSDNIRMLENMINSLQLELEIQKEHIHGSDRIIAISGLLREDLKEREQLKSELKKLIEETKKGI